MQNAKQEELFEEVEVIDDADKEDVVYLLFHETVKNLLKSVSQNLRTVLGKKIDSEKLQSIMQNLSKNRTKTSKRG